MGIRDFFRMATNTKFLGEEIIKKQEDFYQRYQKDFPELEPHAYLRAVWISRMAAHGKNPADPQLQLLSLSETFLCACVPPPQCARALGLYFIYKESPHIIAQNPIFAQEFDRLMGPVFRAQENGTIQELYRTYIPRMAEEASTDASE
jgi:hypothetical protein